jgi:hypothetical protein
VQDPPSGGGEVPHCRSEVVSDDSDRIRIHELINLHGHLFDEGELARLGELLTDDNVVVVKIDSDRAWLRSKGLAVMSNGSTGSVVHDDELRLTGQGWRIAIRRVLPRKAPLQRSGVGEG